MSVLASFESTAMHEREGQLGDVAFTSPQGSVLLFARGNLVVLLQNGGRVIAPVGDLAHRVDRALTERPQVQQRERTAGRSRGGSPAARVGLGESVRLAVDPAIPLSEASDAIPETQTVFASGGTLRREAGGIVFQPGVAGQHHVLVIKRQADERGIAHEFLYQTPADDIGEGDEHRHGSDN
jgi:hypothetical protein